MRLALSHVNCKPAVMNVTRVLGNRVIIELINKEGITFRNGIALPQSATEKPSEGFIRSIGNGNGDVKLQAQLDELTVGDRVKINTDTGSVAVMFDGHNCRIYSILDVQMILS